MLQTKYILLQYENMPCYYELSFDAVVPAILIRVHQDFGEFKTSLQGSHLLKTFFERFKLAKFDEDWPAGKWGFNGCFQYKGITESFIEFSVALPVLEKFHMQTCSYCQGHCKDVLFGGDCEKCHNTGAQNRMVECSWCISSLYDDCSWCKGSRLMADSWMDHDSLFAVCASFAVFFTLMSFGQREDKFVACNKPQLLFVDTSIDKGMGQAPVYLPWGRCATRHERKSNLFNLNKGKELYGLSY